MRTIAVAAGLLLTTITATEASQASRQGPPPPSTPRPPMVQTGPPQSSPGVPLLQMDSQNAQDTREQLRDVLEKYPPAVREVLRLDPTLLYRADYLATYPVLASFLQQHPEIAYNPAYYLGESRVQEENRTNPSTEAFRVFARVTEQAMVVLIIGTITAGILILFRTAIEHRRWNRTMKAQTELHTKLIDRFSSSEELLTYLQSPAARTVIDAPALTQSSARPMHASLNRILWSLQSGIVVGALGSGLMFVSRSATLPEVAHMLWGSGIVVLAIGVGLVLSAVVSYGLSQRLGLVPSLAARHSSETSGT